MVAVTNDVRLPDGTVPSLVSARAELVASDGRPVQWGYVTATGQAVAGVAFTSTTDGSWSMDLPVTSTVSPSGSYYRITEVVQGPAGPKQYVHAIRVTGAATVSELLIEVPASVASAAGQDYVDDALAAFAVNTPTLAQVRSHALLPGLISASTAFPLLITDQAIRVVAVSFCNYNSDIVRDDTNYWNFTLARYRAGVAATIATINTRIAGTGIAINRRTAYDFTGSAFDPDNSLLAAGDIVSLALNANGSPTSLSTFGVTTHWEPT